MLVKQCFSLILFAFCYVACLPTTPSVGLLGKLLEDYAEHAGTTVPKVEDELSPKVEAMLEKLSQSSNFEPKPEKNEKSFFDKVREIFS